MTPRSRAHDHARPVLTQVHLTDHRAEQYRALGTAALLAAHAGDWASAEAVIDGEECRELLAARTAAERHGVFRQFYSWVRTAHITRH